MIVDTRNAFFCDNWIDFNFVTDKLVKIDGFLLNFTFEFESDESKLFNLFLPLEKLERDGGNFLSEFMDVWEVKFLLWAFTDPPCFATKLLISSISLK